MGIFAVELPQSVPNRQFRNMVVSATAAADAKDICKAQLSNGSGASDAAWAAATVTTLADVLASADDALVGWRFRVLVNDTAGTVVADVTFTGTATDDTFDLIGAQLVILLNATASIVGAAYAANVLTVASGGGGDDLGDHTVIFETLPPIVTNVDSGRQSNQDFPVDWAKASQIHQGASSAVLSVTFNVDGTIRPTVLKTYN